MGSECTKSADGGITIVKLQRAISTSPVFMTAGLSEDFKTKFIKK